MALTVGTPAPDFALNTKTADGLKEIKLSDAIGKEKVVLLFFPFAFTSVCQNELCSVSEGLGDYEKLGATVYGISVDSPFAQEAFAKANNITVPLLSDFNTEVSGAYDILYDELLGYRGVAKRSAFVIDEEGKIIYSWSSDVPQDLPDFEAIQSALKG